MTQWNYILKSSKELRDAINSEDKFEVLNALESCWKEIREEFPEDYSRNDYENDYDDIANIRDDLYEDDHYGKSEEDLDDDINWLLNNLYDYCDAMRIWIEL